MEEHRHPSGFSAADREAVLHEREAALDEREAALDIQELAMERLATALKEREETLTETENSSAEDTSSLKETLETWAQRDKALHSREKTLEALEKTLHYEAANIKTRESKLAQAEEKIQEGEFVSHAQQTEWQERIKQLEEENAALADREKERAEKESGLEEKLRELEEKLTAPEPANPPEPVLRESERFTLAAIEGASLGIWEWKIDSNRYYTNEAWAEMLGYLPEDIEPTREFWESLLHSHDRFRIIEEIEDHLDGKTDIFQSEYRLKASTGDWVWVFSLGKVVELDERNSPLTMSGIALDLSEQKVEEDKLKASLENSETQKEKLERELREARKQAEKSSAGKSKVPFQPSVPVEIPAAAGLVPPEPTRFSFLELIEEFEKIYMPRLEGSDVSFYTGIS